MYQQDRQWADTYNKQVMSIIKQQAIHFFDISSASTERDMKCATDFTLRFKGGDIAVRLRRPFKDKRDLTIRSHRNSGAKTELAKIREGFGAWYFYGWIDRSDIISEWILVDLDKVRSSGLLDKERRPIPNTDGATFFIAISLEELCEAGCLVAQQLQEPVVPRHRGGLPEGGYLGQLWGDDKAS